MGTLNFRKTTVHGDVTLASFGSDYRVEFTCCGCSHRWVEVARVIKFNGCPKCGGNVFDADAEVAR